MELQSGPTNGDRITVWRLMKPMNTQYTHMYYVNKNFILDAIHRFTPLVKTLC